MEEEFARTKALIGEEALQIVRKARIAVFGLGGVGGYTVESLVRTGIGALDIIDGDTVAPSNINRQIFALRSTIGRYKADAAKERLLDIQPACKITPYALFYNEKTASRFDFSQYDYVIDAVDTVQAKIALIEAAVRAGTPVISSMGAGNKMNPCAFEVADIFETSVCPLARVMRRELRKRDIQKLKTVYSKETPVKTDGMQTLDGAECYENSSGASEEKTAFSSAKKIVPASIAFVPAAAGLLIASEVVKDLIDWKRPL
ncbi:MAG: tRNA threonylcarbamoyladenosine dehydratase [Treponema sp.]